MAEKGPEERIHHVTRQVYRPFRQAHRCTGNVYSHERLWLGRGGGG